VRVVAVAAIAAGCSSDAAQCRDLESRHRSIDVHVFRN